MAIQRQTNSLKKVWHQFENSNEALSVVDLVKQLTNEMNKTTVYRILDRMESDGKLHSFTGKDGLKWYAKCHECTGDNHIDLHPHFQCNTCGKVECLPEEIQIPNISKYEIEQAQVLFLGKCDRCKS